MNEISFALDFHLPLESSVHDLLAESLYEPIQNFLQRPAKMIRGQMVRAGFLLSGSEICDDPVARTIADSHCLRLAEVLEAIHAGSLVVDDIQDGSKVRRGSPTLHEIYGMPIALNAGNWLYFGPMQWIRGLGLPERKELRLYQMYHETLLRAHLGQALDIGTSIDLLPKERVPSVCLASLELKTGALMALALTAGAVIGDANESRLRHLNEFGHRFGVALQMFDDIGNLNLAAGDLKRFEDLTLRRPTWIWAASAAQSSEPEYNAFKNAVDELPDDKSLLCWLEATDFRSRAQNHARAYLAESLKFLNEVAPSQKSSASASAYGSASNIPSAAAEGHSILKQLAQKIEVSYG